MIEWIKLGLSVLSFLTSVGMFIYVRSDRKERATVKSIDDLKESVNKRFSEKCDRISKLEGDVNRIPSRAEFDAAQERGRQEIVRIHQRIDEINSGIKTSQLMIGELIGITKGAKNG